MMKQQNGIITMVFGSKMKKDTAPALNRIF